MTERRKIGRATTFEFHARDGAFVLAIVVFMGNRIYDLSYSFSPHWLVEDVHFEEGVKNDNAGART